MKKLLIIFIIGLFPSIIFAQEKKINCDDLARHMKHELADEDHFGVYEESSPSRLMVRWTRMHSNLWGKSWKTHHSAACKKAGEWNHDKAVDFIPERISLLQKYQHALKQCVESSAPSGEETLETMRYLQKKTDKYTKCVALFNEGRNQAVNAAARGHACEKYINMANKNETEDTTESAYEKSLGW